MRLKKLQLHGYKTFADRTELIFDEGITAIVGPNGSGKSNIADAIRWVMGEQAYATLRGKKTEDMIFSGSNGRARMGMAEVTLTLDNSDNRLPIAFSEVVITRRAYRSGENEYFVNGQRVRLRDVQELLDRSGLGRRTHLVIGQGLIDQALALRPEDRRELFEEAAGVTLYRHKRRQALERLDQTAANLSRVRDIIAEITPRLRQLERQAERARHYEETAAQLRRLLLVWYGHAWHLGLSRLEDARAAAQHWQETIARTEAQIEAQQAALADLRRQQTELRRQLSEWQQQLDREQTARTALHREQAIGEERLRGLAQVRERLASELQTLAVRLAGEQEQQQQAEAALAMLEQQYQNQQRQWQEAQEALAAVEAERRQVEAELNATRRRALDLQTQQADRENRIRQNRERSRALASERERVLVAAAAAAAESARLEQDLRAAEATLAGLTAQAQALGMTRQESEARRRQIRTQQAQMAAEQAEWKAQIRSLRSRLELLERLHDEGEGFAAGVRHVLQAARRGQLHGIYGPLADLLEVPARFEQAIEVALGGRLQDIVVARWDDAEAAIALLKHAQAGRATFLPLDHLRPPGRRPLPRQEGVLGWAADLVGFAPEVRPAVELLLGQVLVVTDLSAARRLAQAEDRPRMVTLEGDFVHPGGSISGGSRETRRQSNVLARARERRQLPAQIDELSRKLQALEAEQERLTQSDRELEAELSALAAQAAELAKAEREATATLHRLQAAQERSRQNEAWQQERAQQLTAEMEALDRQGRMWQQEQQELMAAYGETSRRLAALEEHLATLSLAGPMQAVAQAQARLESLAVNRRQQQALLETHRRNLHQLEAEMAERRRRLQALEAEMAAHEDHMRALQAALQTLDERCQGLEAQIEPAQAELERLEALAPEYERAIEQLRTRQHQEAIQYNQAQLACQRAEDHLAFLRSQIEHDFGLVTLETGAEVIAQEPLPFDAIVTTLPRVETIPPDMETEIQRLKGILNRLGPINPTAPAEYAAVRERHAFLTRQAADLEEADKELRRVIVELDRLMASEFRRTFEAVARAFGRYFTRLFGGGTARLVLTNDEDLNTTGVEIIARPPGKKTTQLSLLSGGERALTAAALIFSLLSVNPMPFCVLDEVDAALDEANTGRVSEVLRELAQQAQLIVITHNRGTMAIANTIYGVSMGSDSVSRTVSLRLRADRLEAMEAGS
jgi:chromosome segregation protein